MIDGEFASFGERQREGVQNESTVRIKVSGRVKKVGILWLVSVLCSRPQMTGQRNELLQ